MGFRVVPVIPKDLVESVKWETDPESYDDRLRQLGREYDEFIVINPVVGEWILEYIDQTLRHKKCIVWMIGDFWVAKKFQHNWNKSLGWKTVRISGITEISEWNKDLPAIFTNFNYTPLTTDLLLEHVWYLDPRFYNKEKIWVRKTRYFDHVVGEKDMGYISPTIAQELAVVFISYDEPNAESNWERVLKKAPHAKRVHGVKGIFEAHKAAAKLADTSMFYVVDGDAEVLDDFNFNFVPDIFNLDVVHVWHSRNPINDLEYGYGGVKLFPRRLLIDAETWGVDMTTSLGNKFKVIDRVSNITAFNTDPFSTWKSAFRECAKLASGVIDSTGTDRLNIWLTTGKDQPFGEYAIAGAVAGKEFGIQNKNDPDKLKQINDRSWLEEQFKCRTFM